MDEGRSRQGWEQAYHVSELGVLLKVLRDAVGELLVILLNRVAGRLVERDERPGQELLVFVLQGQGKSIDYTAQDFQKLRNSIMPLRLIDKAVKYIADSLLQIGNH